MLAFTLMQHLEISFSQGVVALFCKSQHLG